MHYPTIALIIPYFGSSPKWFSIFIETCKHNPSVSFFLFTDFRVSIPVSKNIHIIPFSLTEFNSLASKKLGLAVNILHPYKVCDFKPAFGVLFEDYLNQYKFWGHCDLDIVLGDIRKFITNEVLADYDVITARKEYLVGHFTLYKNYPKTNRLFEESSDYKFVFQSQKSFSFDECNFWWWNLLAGASISDTNPQIDSMTHVVKRLETGGYLKAYFETLILEQIKFNDHNELEDWTDTVMWDNGKLFDLEQYGEYLYFHFHFLKRKKDFLIPDWTIVPAKFFISNTGFSC